MLKELKKAMQITVTDFDPMLANFLMAGASDLTISGVQLPGDVTFTISQGDVVTDTSTLTDPKAMQAVLTYAAAHAEKFWNGKNADALEEAYESQKGQLMHATGYTDYGEETEQDGGEGA